MTNAPLRSVFGRSRADVPGRRESVALRRAELQAKLAGSYVRLWERNEAHALRALEQARTELARWQARLVEINQHATTLRSERRDGDAPRSQ